MNSKVGPAEGTDMRVIVFGATSKLGRQVWRKALDAGHQVTVFGRLVKRLSEEEPALKTVMGDLIDAGAVPKAIARQDAVIVCLGTDYREEHAEPSACTNIIVNAMVRYDIKRLSRRHHDRRRLVQGKDFKDGRQFSAFSGPHPSAFRGLGWHWRWQWRWLWRFQYVWRPRTSRRHHQRQPARLDHRPCPVINDRSAPGFFERSTNVSREDVASFMVKQLTNLTNNHRTITARSSEGSPAKSEPHAAEPTPSDTTLRKASSTDYPLVPGPGTKKRRSSRFRRTP